MRGGRPAGQGRLDEIDGAEDLEPAVGRDQPGRLAGGFEAGLAPVHSRDDAVEDIRADGGGTRTD